jgi:hypothetical protein
MMRRSATRFGCGVMMIIAGVLLIILGLLLFVWMLWRLFI